jgi:uncharacterized membrane protein YvbJ
MGEKPRKPRFFCDGCGTEVSADAKGCPNCGKFFASMRCPRCGFCGEHGEFRRGCPNCGYAAHDAPVSKPPPPSRQQKPAAASGVQLVYILSIAALVLLLTLLFTYIPR